MILICEDEVGNINLNWHPRLVRFPGLRVRGRLRLEGCPNLKSVGAGLVVEKVLDLDYCQKLHRLPDGLWVGGNLWLCGITSLSLLPLGLRVGGELDLNYSSVFFLPADARIEGMVLGLEGS